MASRKIRFGLAAALGLVLILVAIALGARWRSEPGFQGKRVSYWIRELGYEEMGRTVMATASFTPSGRVLVVSSVGGVLSTSTVFTPSSNRNGMIASPLRVGTVLPAGTNRVVVAGTNRLVVVSNRNPNSTNPMVVLDGIGEPAVPYLASALQRKDSVWATQYRRLHAKLPSAASRFLPAPPIPADAMRRAAARALAALGDRSKSAAPALVEALKDSDYKVQSVAAEAVRKLASTDDNIGDLVIRFLQPTASNEEMIRYIARLELRGPNVIAALGRAARDPKAEVRRNALFWLQRLGRGLDSAIPIFTRALLDNDYEIRYMAVWTLAEAGPAAKPAIPELKRARNDESELIRSMAEQTLKGLTTEQSTPTSQSE